MIAVIQAILASVIWILYVLYTSGFDSVLYPIVKPTWLYRIIQKILEGIGLYFVYTFSGIDAVGACLLCHYFMVMDFLYYVFRNEFYKLDEEFTGTDKVPYWLDRIYFSGRWVFQYGFTIKKFFLSALAGVMLGGIVAYFHVITFIYNFIKDLL